MIKIILDPNLFECDENTSREYQIKHFNYLEFTEKLFHERVV